MEKPQNNQTHDEILTPSEAKRKIRLLEDKITHLEARLKKSGENTMRMAEKNTQHSRKAKRLEARVTFLEKRVTQLEDFIRENGLEPPQAEPETVEIHKQKKEE